MENPRFVIVDDSAFQLCILKIYLNQTGMLVGEAGTLEEVIRVVKEQRPDVVTMDITLPEPTD